MKGRRGRIVNMLVVINVAVHSDIREKGLFLAIGLEAKGLIYIEFCYISLIIIVAFPIGLISGISIDLIALRAGMNALVIPGEKIFELMMLCLIAIYIAAIYPALKASHGVPLDAINTNRNKKDAKYSRLVKLDSNYTSSSFSLRLGLKNSITNWKRSSCLIFVVTLLLTLFIQYTEEIEVTSKIGAGRLGYTSDYVIDIPYIKYNSKSLPYYDKNVRPVTTQFLTALSRVSGVQKILCQSSIMDQQFSSNNNIHSYYFKLIDNNLTAQGRTSLKNADNIASHWNISDVDFVQAGIGGYGDNELAFAKKYLVEGSIDIQKMKAQPIILLPKYISSIGNLNIPYTNLKVGDTITLLDSKGDSMQDIKTVSKSTYTIGGFVDPLPFPQINGVTNGFVAIMSEKQFKKLSTPYKAVREVYVDTKVKTNPLNSVATLCRQNGYQLTDNKDTFVYNETKTQTQRYSLLIYCIFGIIGFVIFLALFNVFFSEIIARKSEFALLFAIGMSKWQIILSSIGEIFLLSTLGCLMGAIFGIVSALKSKPHSIGDELLTYEQKIPWAHISIGICIIISACVIALAISILYCIKSISVRDIDKQ